MKESLTAIQQYLLEFKNEGEPYVASHRGFGVCVGAHVLSCMCVQYVYVLHSLCMCALYSMFNAL